MKLLTPPLVVFSFILGILSVKADAAIVLIDLALNTKSFSTSHLGSDSFELRQFGLFLDYTSSGSDARMGTEIYFNNQGARRRRYLVSANGSIDLSGGTSTGGSYADNGVFAEGIQAGLNYARWDLDNNGVFETVLELNFGANVDASDDSFTRYFYDDSGSSLSISGALSSVPEPSSSTLALIGSLTLILRRKK